MGDYSVCYDSCTRQGVEPDSTIDIMIKAMQTISSLKIKKIGLEVIQSHPLRSRTHTRPHQLRLGDQEMGTSVSHARNAVR